MEGFVCLDFETEYHIAQAGLELYIVKMTLLNSWPSCLYLLVLRTGPGMVVPDFPTSAPKCVNVVYGCGVGASGGGRYMYLCPSMKSKEHCVHLSHSALFLWRKVSPWKSSHFPASLAASKPHQCPLPCPQLYWCYSGTWDLAQLVTVLESRLVQEVLLATKQSLCFSVRFWGKVS